MIKFNIITLFPDLIENHLKFPPFKKALKNNLIYINTINLRDYSNNNYKSVDDKPYGGGVGMILSVEPIYNCIKDNNIKKGKNKKIILLSPKGNKFNQQLAKEYTSCKEITLICGRYEGVDARVEHYCTDIISIGDYILSGGEIAALAIVEASTRLIPGVIEKSDVVIQDETFENNKLEYPQYTRPENFRGYPVPKILLSGDHKKIEIWRNINSKNLIKN